jgi:hypothetical protein
MGTKGNPTCSDLAGARSSREVRLRAATYRWACPNCGTLNARQPLARQVVCSTCGQPFPTLGTRDKFLVMDGGEPGAGTGSDK